MESITPGAYFFVSPYHKSKRLLPFVIRYVTPSAQTAQVSTVEYKGYTRNEVDSEYPLARIKEMLTEGFLKPAKEVKQSYVIASDKYLLDTNPMAL